MKYNTIPFKNITDKKFTGKYDGFEFIVEPDEIRYWPSELSLHCAKQLINDILLKLNLLENKEGHLDKDELKRQILGNEIQTAEQFRFQSFAEEAADHEKKYVEMIKSKRKEDIINMDIVLDDSSNNHNA